MKICERFSQSQDQKGQTKTPSTEEMQVALDASLSEAEELLKTLPPSESSFEAESYVEIAKLKRGS